MKKYSLNIVLSAATVLLLAGCSSGDGTVGSSTAYFVDSAVGGVSYSSISYSGTTSSTGAFNYKVGETTTFKIGNVTLGSISSVPAGGKIMPQNLAGIALSQKNSTSTAIAQFLQSLDEDGNPDNGITISSATSASLSTAQTLSSANLSSLVSTAGKSLVSSTTALAHLATTTTSVSGSTVTSFSDYIASSVSSSSTGSTVSTAGTVTATTTGTVSGSYYEDATVCFDVNANGACDAGEITVTSNASGDFTLSGAGDYDIVAIIPAGAIKHEVIGDTGTAITSSTTTLFAIPKVAIAQAKLDGGKVVMSAISTKLYTYAKDNTGATIDEIKTAVAASLGIDKDDLLKDFNSPSVPASVKVALKAKSDTLLIVMAGKTTPAEVKTAVATVVSAMNLPSNIDVVSAK